ncbi:XRCC4-like factor-domain-containing protein [Achaetomium macrosporum]|uniref:Non-homologous end-joining factor 1 n=1 Tax=Achaetomium macrosporum TaxID=79813 RepID=A0AAN7CE27_9PEZI|nr:XRCC4-like factor-domain-containing protein [Achaetomium macrosporum]
MPGHPSWRLLPAAAPDIPTLLVSTAFTESSYTVHLSDLANVWVESLDKKPLTHRGVVEGTSIDPSDGPDQIRRLLELLAAAFDSNDSEHANTSLTLTRGEDGDSLVLLITCLLPEPLEPLKWQMRLKKCPQSTIASELVLPLIQAHEARARDIDYLVSLLRDKDAVITRLIDKLEATGTGLEYVFHALSGKRKVTRATAEAKVKGLVPFSEADFRNKTAELRDVAQASDVSALLGTVFGASGLQYSSDLEVEAFSVLNDWWTNLAKGRKVVLSERAGKQEPRKAPPPLEPEPSKEEEDDFQVQATPPGMRSAKRPEHPSETADEDETSDGEDIAEGPARSPAPKATVGVKGSGSRHGTIGRPKRPSPSPPPHSTSQRSTGRRPAPAYSESETASEGDDDDTHSSPPPSSPKPSPRRGGLGRIGGKPKTEISAAKSPSPSPPEGEASQLPRRHKLGVIGKKAPSPGPEASAASASDDTRGRSKTPASAPKEEQVRETSQERADRKRAELQREMEKRVAAGPAKKKRKF